MSNDPIPPTDHVSRLCSRSRVNVDGSISGTAFRLHPKDKEYLSVNWLEFLKLADRGAEVTTILVALKDKGLVIKEGAKLAILNVGHTQEYVLRRSPDSRQLKMLHIETKKDPSYSGIYGLKLEPVDDLVADLIAESIRETYPANP